MRPRAPEPIDSDPRRLGRIVVSLASFWVVTTFVRTWSRRDFGSALADGWRSLFVAIVGGTAIWLVETRLTGSALWWGRVAEVCLALGALLVAIAWDGGVAGIAMAVIFWAGLCSAGIAWLLLKADVPD